MRELKLGKISGKKNYLPPSYLIYGFGLLFKVSGFISSGNSNCQAENFDKS